MLDGITGNSIPSQLQASCPQLTMKQNRSGIYVIFNGPGYTPLTNEFIPNPSTWPTTQQTYEVTVSDPGLRYLPRRANVTAPMSLTALTPQNVSLISRPFVGAGSKLGGRARIGGEQRRDLWLSRCCYSDRQERQLDCGNGSFGCAR